MKTTLTEIQKKLAEIPTLKYVDEDWGQLDYYSPNMPVQFPCCLIDVQAAQFDNLSKDFGKRPKDRQKATVHIELTLANMKLSNTSYKSPKVQKTNAWAIYDIAESVHNALHGVSLTPNASKMLRTSFGRAVRDDGVQEYRIGYILELFNV